MVLGLLLRKELRDRALSLVVACALLVFLAVMTGWLYAPMADQFRALREALPAVLLALIPGGEMASATGWVNAQVMSLVGPGVLIALAVMSALRSTVGEEDRGTLGLLLSVGVSRGTFVAAKWVAMLTQVAVAGTVLAISLIGVNAVWDLGLAGSDLLLGCVFAVALAWFFGALALALALSTGRLRISAMTASAFAAVSFLVATFFPLSDSLRKYDQWSLWFYYSASDPLAGTASGVHFFTLIAASLMCLLPGIWAFHSRDLKN